MNYAVIDRSMIIPAGMEDDDDDEFDISVQALLVTVHILEIE